MIDSNKEPALAHPQIVTSLFVAELLNDSNAAFSFSEHSLDQLRNLQLLILLPVPLVSIVSMVSAATSSSPFSQSQFWHSVSACGNLQGVDET